MIHETETEYQYARVIERHDGKRALELNEGQAVHSLYQPGTVLTGDYWDGHLVLPFAALRTARRGAGRDPRQRGRHDVARLRASSSPARASTGSRSTPSCRRSGARCFDMRRRRTCALHHEDARPFLRRTDARYDVIFVDAYRQPYIPFYLADARVLRARARPARARRRGGHQRRPPRGPGRARAGADRDDGRRRSGTSCATRSSDTNTLLVGERRGRFGGRGCAAARRAAGRAARRSRSSAAARLGPPLTRRRRLHRRPGAGRVADRQVDRRLRGRRMSELAAGLRAAPLALDDAAEVTRVWRACELHDDGEAMFTAEDFVAAWRVPSFAPARRASGSAARTARRARRAAGRPARLGVRAAGTAGAASALAAGVRPGRAYPRRTRSSPRPVGDPRRRAGAHGGDRLRAALGVLDLRDRADPAPRAGAAAAGLRAPYVRPRAGRPRRAPDHRRRVREWPDREAGRSRTGRPRRSSAPGFVPRAHVVATTRTSRWGRRSRSSTRGRAGSPSSPSPQAGARGRGPRARAARARVRHGAAARALRPLDRFADGCARALRARRDARQAQLHRVRQAGSSA